MIRAVFFDFYSVWTPDKLAYYLAYAQMRGPALYKELYDASEAYYQGSMSLDDLAGTFRHKLGATDISAQAFTLSANSISPEIPNFIRSLHGHFLKVGVLANLGPQEYEVLKQFNDANQAIEVVMSPYSLSLKKPLLDQEVFTKAFEAIGETADTCLLVSGNPAYLAFGRLLGAQTLQFSGLKGLEQHVAQLLAKDAPA